MKIRIVPANELSTRTLRADDYVKGGDPEKNAGERDLKHVCEVFSRKGWYPVKWSHHPKVIKDALRDIGLRPQIKQCFANCQRLLLSGHPIAEELEYHEGYVQTVIPIQHAWLVLGHAIIDLTLAPERGEIRYLDSMAYTTSEVRAAVLRKQCFGPVSDVALALLSPFAAHFASLPGHQLDEQIKYLLLEGFEPARIPVLYERVGIAVDLARIIKLQEASDG